MGYSGREALTIAKLFILKNIPDKACYYFQIAKHFADYQFENRTRKSGKSISHEVRKEEKRIMHTTKLECCLYLQDRDGAEIHLQELLNLKPFPWRTGMNGSHFYLGLLSNDYLDEVRKINVKKKWQKLIGVMKDGIINLIVEDYDQFERNVLIHCENFKSAVIKGMWGLFENYDGLMVNLLLISRMKGRNLEIRHDAIPEYFGGLGTILHYPRIDPEHPSENEFVFHDFTGLISQGTYYVQGKGDFKEVRCFGNTLRFNQYFEFYQENTHQLNLPIPIRIHKKGCYRMLFRNHHPEQKDLPRKIFVLEFESGKNGKIERSYTYSFDEPSGPDQGEILNRIIDVNSILA